MRWFVYIFSLYLLILSGLTCNAAGDCCKDEIPAETSAGHQDDDDHRPVSLCSPFFACGTCHSVLTPELSFDFPQPFTLTRKLHFFYGEISFTDLTLSFWQPPQIS
jgi:hypothetical protein